MSRLGNVGGRLYRGEVSIDFVGRRKMFYAISGLILLVSVVSLGVRGLSFSVDFKGGSVFQFSAPVTGSVSPSQVDRIVTNIDAGADPTTTVTRPPNKTPQWQVQTASIKVFQEGSRIQDALAKEFGLKGGAEAVSRTFVSATWGSQIESKAFEGLIAFLIVVMIYLSIAFEWRMASAALVALAHDIVITIGVYSLAGFQVSPATVIGLLTILGYSLYDTVVVFDKVRENTAGLVGTKKSTYSGAANLALNQTLVRSINTSLIALLPVASILVVAVAFLGAGELQDLSLVLFVGMLSGTYSSICVATPVLTDLKEREPQYKNLARLVALRESGGRAAQRKARAATGAAGSATGGGVTRGTAVLEAEDDDTDEPSPTDAPIVDGNVTNDEVAADPGTSEPVTAGRATTSGPARGTAGRPAPRPQQRRSTGSKRRPAGKKKRR
jgi:preprotein translocase subunit SecF